MRAWIYIMAAVTFLTACKNEPKVKKQSDLPIHQDTSRVQEQSNWRADSLNNYIAENPNDVDALINRSRRYIENKNLKYAAADASAALDIDSNNANVLLLWGEINYLSNQTRLSKNAWERCIEVDPQNVDCRLKLAELYNIVQEYNKSQKLVDEAIEIDNSSAVAFFIKGMNIRDMKGDTATALQYFQRAIDLDNYYMAALDMMAVMLSAQGDSLSLLYFNRILEIDPNNYPTYYNRGMFHLKQKNWQQAVEDFTTCTQLKKTDTESLFNLGYIHLQLRNYDIARDYFSQAIAIQSVNPRALYGRGYAWEMLGDVTNAERDYKEALRYNPQHEPSKIALQRLASAGN